MNLTRIRPTEKSFKEMELPETAASALNAILTEIKNYKLRKFGSKKKLLHGFHTLFSGNGSKEKTLAAAILGKSLNREVYRIDLSAIISNYIGETEKNLEKIFGEAEGKEWILYFDEADALFGKRTEVRDAHDKYANQEIAYFQQKIQSYNGLIILATNAKQNIDPAFLRRIRIINF